MPDSRAEPPLPPPDNDSVIEFRNVSITFDRDPVLQDVSFHIARGETRVLLGPAGGGKSVLMKLANGLLQPDEGEVRVFGQNLAKVSERAMFALRARIGMVFQESALFDSMNVEDNVSYRLCEDKVPEPEIRTRVLEALRFVELDAAVGKFPSELSGGMRRRVSIARAIVSRPELLLYDSPTGGLDPITSNTIIELIVKQRDVSGATALLITHRLQDAFTLATHRFNSKTNCMQIIPDNGLDPNTRFLVLNEGRVTFNGTTRELTHTEDPWLRAYLA